MSHLDSCEYKPSKVINKYFSLSLIQKTEWLVHKLIRLMDPRAKADHFREFLKQIGKYLLMQDNDKRSKLQEELQEKLRLFQEHRAQLNEEKDGEELDFYDYTVSFTKSPLKGKTKEPADDIDFGDWIQSYFTPNAAKSSEQGKLLRKASITKRIVRNESK